MGKRAADFPLQQRGGLPLRITVSVSDEHARVLVDIRKQSGLRMDVITRMLLARGIEDFIRDGTLVWRTPK